MNSFENKLCQLVNVQCIISQQNTQSQMGEQHLEELRQRVQPKNFIPSQDVLSSTKAGRQMFLIHKIRHSFENLTIKSSQQGDESKNSYMERLQVNTGEH